MGCDLHLHTTASDGSVQPAHLVEIAFEAGLDAIAITDHDTFAGLEEAFERAKNLPIEIIPGVELSCDFDGRDVHIIAYWPDYEVKWLNDELSTLRKGRYERARLIVGKFQEQGLNITFQEVKDIADGAAIGRSHLARVLMKKGYVQSIQEAFDKYLEQDGCCYVKKPTKTVAEVLATIKKAKGVAVLAHPGLMARDEEIGAFAEQGLAGIEVHHPDHSPEQVKSYLEIANRYGLVATGGSDFHARKSGRGSYVGAYQVGIDAVEALRKIAEGNAEFGIGRTQGSAPTNTL